MSNHTVINIPKKLLSSNKRCKSKLELISFALIIKCLYGDSKFKDVSIIKTMQLLHCGHDKAKKLIQEAKSDDELFSYNPYTNTLFSKSFRRAYKEVSTDMYGRTIYMMYAIKFDKKESYNLRDVVKELRKLLFLNAVNAVERVNQFHAVNKNKMSFSTTTGALTQRKIGNIVGLSGSSASRIIKRMEEDKAIKVNRDNLRVVETCVNEETMREAKRKHKIVIYDSKKGVAYTIVPNSYATTSLKQTEKFGNIIFNHESRYTFNKKANNLTKVDEYYERFID